MSGYIPRKVSDGSGLKCPDTFDSYWMIRDSVERSNGLIYGTLHDGAQHCAIGAFFRDNPKLALKNDIIEEVAAYNDSIPKSVPERQRRDKVLRWLTAKIRTMECLATVFQKKLAKKRRAA